MENIHVPMEDASQVLSFWFEELTEEDWFGADPNVDAMIASQFGGLHKAASRCELWPWRATAHGRLAEIILLDQFSRNIYRNKPAAFKQDAAALCLAQEAVSVNADASLTPTEKAFLYMPFMHSESAAVHDVAMQLFAVPGLETQLEFERRHRDIILRFGRYPHRNEIIGRASTDEELQFLATSESSF